MKSVPCATMLLGGLRFLRWVRKVNVAVSWCDAVVGALGNVPATLRTQL